jgi:hypothetical protein
MVMMASMWVVVSYCLLQTPASRSSPPVDHLRSPLLLMRCRRSFQNGYGFFIFDQQININATQFKRNIKNDLVYNCLRQSELRRVIPISGMHTFLSSIADQCFPSKHWSAIEERNVCMPLKATSLIQSPTQSRGVYNICGVDNKVVAFGTHSMAHSLSSLTKGQWPLSRSRIPKELMKS